KWIGRWFGLHCIRDDGRPRTRKSGRRGNRYGSGPVPFSAAVTLSGLLIVLELLYAPCNVCKPVLQIESYKIHGGGELVPLWINTGHRIVAQALAQIISVRAL